MPEPRGYVRLLCDGQERLRARFDSQKDFDRLKGAAEEWERITDHGEHTSQVRLED